MNEDNWEINVERGDGCNVEFTVRIPSDDVEEQRKQTINELRQQVDEPGFRKGRVPRSLIEKKYEPRLKQNLLEKLIPQACRTVYEKHEIQPVSQPQVEDFDLNGEFYLKARVDERPTVDVSTEDYRGLKLRKPESGVSEDDVEDQIEELRSNKAQLEPIPLTRPVQQGDFVRIDFQGYDEQGEPVEGTSAEDTIIEIGSERFLPELEEGLVGAEEGDQRRIQATFEEDFVDENLAGRTLEFDVSVKEIQEQRKPELEDEEFLEDMGVESAEELREKIRDRLQEADEQDVDQQLSQQVYEQLLEVYNIDLPESLVEREVEGIIDSQRQQIESQGRDFEEFLEEQDQTEEELREDARPEAERRIRLTLIFQAIAEQEAIEVSDEELQEHLEEIAGQYGVDVEELTENISDQQKHSIRQELRDEKVLDYLIDEASVKTVDPDELEEEPSDQPNEEQNQE